ncbi:hypothetical protein FSP39_010659 [Pinctada imbricata]|uniref:B box-type domain-containing protein n=1 Tax=Pinctada imbricata TaxID=66713 RepID=A0AA88XZI5_PINIB|nr:hypothetical protein FSP39_010659 [Pinctada imbricata]
MNDNSTTTFPTQIVVTCGFCDGTTDVKWFCKSCAASMCNTCKTSHLKITAFKNHVIVPRTNDVMRLYGPSKIAEQCSLHPDKEISIYCKDCQEPCCVTCLVQKHEGHKISSIEDVYLSAEKRLNENAKKLEKDVMPTLDKMVNETEKNRSEKREKINEVRDEINTFRNEMKQTVDVSCDNLLKTLDQNEIEFDYLIKRIDAQKRKVRELIKSIDEIIQKGDLSMIKYSPPSPGTLIPEVGTPKLTIPVFTPGRDILTIIRDRIGNIEWTDKSSGQTDASSITKFDPSMIHINEVGSFTSKIDVTSITTAGNNTAWVMWDDSDTMYLYDSSGKVVRSITVKGSKGINDMVIRRSGEMIVTCNDRKVRRVSVSGEVSTLIYTSPYRPEGVCLTDSEDVVVCKRGQVKKNNYIAVHSPDTGIKLREIRGIDGQGKQQTTDPYRVVSNGKDLYVVNCDPCHVVCVDERGDVKWVYDGKETKLSKSFDLRGISVDKYNNLFVTDWNNDCVHYIDRDGILIQTILIQDQTGLSGHWGICVDDKTGQVWVGNWDLRCLSQVVISKYL